MLPTLLYKKSRQRLFETFSLLLIDHAQNEGEKKTAPTAAIFFLFFFQFVFYL